MSDEGPHATDAFDPFEIIKAEPVERDIMLDRQGFLASEANEDSDEGMENLPYGEVPDLQPFNEESRRAAVLSGLNGVFHTDDPERLIAALEAVEGWLRGTEAGTAPQDVADGPLTDSDPVSRVPGPDEV